MHGWCAARWARWVRARVAKNTGKFVEEEREEKKYLEILAKVIR